MSMAPVTGQLILIQGDSQHFQRVIDLRSNNITIGRAQSCNVIWSSLQISRRHASMEHVISKWYIRDTSTNGLSVNGKKLVKGELFQLRDTDLISFIPTGAVRYRFRYVEPTTSAEPTGPITQHSTISPQPSTSFSVGTTCQRALPVRLQTLVSNSLDLSDSEDSNHSESLLSLDGPEAEDYAASLVSLDDAEVSRPESPSRNLGSESDDGSLLSISKPKKHKHDSSDSDCPSKMRKKKKTSIFDDDVLESPRSPSPESECDRLFKTGSKALRALGAKLMTEDQINTCDDMQTLRTQLKACMAKLGSTEIELKTVEIERNIEREEMRRKENDVDSVNTAFKEETYLKIMELLESELSCVVCNEVFIQATVIDCGHTFCSFCINEWARKKQECPICRKGYRNKSRHIEVENFITRMFESFSGEIATKRKNSIKDREDQAKKATEDALRAAENAQARGTGGNFHAFIQSTAERYVDFLAELQQINEVLGPRLTRGNAAGVGADRRRSARIQERVVDVVGTNVQGPPRSRRGRARNAVANNNNAGAAAAAPEPVAGPSGAIQLIRHAIQPVAGPSTSRLAPIPVVTLNDSVDEGVRFPNQFMGMGYIPLRRVPVTVPTVSLVDLNSRNTAINRNGNVNQ